MATDPTMQDPNADPSQDDESAPAEDDMSQGFTIELSCLPDNTYKVSGPEPLQEEAEEEQGEPGSEQGQDFPTLAAALKGVMMAVKSAQGSTSEDTGAGEDAMSAGFNSVRGQQ